MGKITQFSKSEKFTEGTCNLIGVMGLPFAQIGSLNQFSGLNINPIAEKPTKILLHYLTEPPKINFVEVTSFLQGGIYGIDCNKPSEDFQKIFTINRENLLIEPASASPNNVIVYDAAVLINHSREFLREFPILPGSLVFEAHSEYYCESTAEIYALLAIAKPVNPNQNYLLMEDSGEIKEGETFRMKQESLSQSIIGCEQAENSWGDENTQYQEIYLIGMSHTAPHKSWIQVQMIYCAPPKKSIEKTP